MRPGRARGRFSLAVYGSELAIGSVAGLALFLFLLWMLQRVFPEATDLGDLVRSRASRERGPAPVAALGDASAVAVLSAIHRDVRDKPASSLVWSAAERGSVLADGDAVQSYAGSAATITFDDHNRLDLGEKSLIVLRKPRRREDAPRPRAAVLFMEGFLRGRLGGGGPDGLAPEILAGGGTVRPREPEGDGVQIALAMDKDSSALSVHDGDAEVVWNGRVTVVPSGHMVTFDPSHAPGAPVPLPLPPAPISPKDGESFRYRAAPPRIPFSWREADDASEFTLQIARDPRFAGIVFERRQSGTTFTHGALDAGEYFWRVQSRRGRIASAEGRVSRFTVEASQRPPKLRVDLPAESVAGRTVVIRGEIEPGCRVIIGGATVATDADGRFEHTLELRAGHNFVVVQAVDPLGNTAFESRTIVSTSEATERAP